MNKFLYLIILVVIPLILVGLLSYNAKTSESIIENGNLINPDNPMIKFESSNHTIGLDDLVETNLANSKGYEIENIDSTTKSSKKVWIEQNKRNNQEIISLTPISLENLLLQADVENVVPKQINDVIELHKSDILPLTEWSIETQDTLLNALSKAENIDVINRLGFAANNIECKSSTCAIDLEFLNQQDFDKEYQSVDFLLEAHSLLNSFGVINRSTQIYSSDGANNNYILYIKNEDNN